MKIKLMSSTKSSSRCIRDNKEEEDFARYIYIYIYTVYIYLRVSVSICLHMFYWESSRCNAFRILICFISLLAVLDSPHLLMVDRYILHRLGEFLASSKANYESYRFGKGIESSLIKKLTRAIDN